MKKLFLILLIPLTFSCCTTKETVYLSESGGTYLINATIDDSINVDFILDTGASECVIPFYLLKELVLRDKIESYDVLEPKRYLLADGSVVVCNRVLVNKLQIGDTIIYDIEFSINENVNSPLLLGQNALKKLKTIKIDYELNTITYERHNWYNN